MFERGFKSWCENVATEMRRELNLDEAAPLPPEVLAQYLKVFLWSSEQIEELSPAAVCVLKREHDSWPALTVSWASKDAIIVNAAHSERRRSSDVMHELAHIPIGHPPATVVLSVDGALALRTFSKRQEDEANWLSRCLLLPHPALLAVAQSRRPRESVCSEYRVTNELLTYRMNVTAVSTQMRRSQGTGA